VKIIIVEFDRVSDSEQLLKLFREYNLAVKDWECLKDEGRYVLKAQFPYGALANVFTAVLEWSLMDQGCFGSCHSDCFYMNRDPREMIVKIGGQPWECEPWDGECLIISRKMEAHGLCVKKLKFSDLGSITGQEATGQAEK
jgi:hypothetical protein